MRRFQISFFVAIVLIISSCSPGGSGVFSGGSPRDRYESKLEKAGLENSTAVKQWLAAGENALANPVTVKLPFRETGYFDALQPRATAYRFEVQRGQLLKISVSLKPDSSFNMFLDLWEPSQIDDLNAIASVDSSALVLEEEIDADTSYILRLQPELLQSGEYTLSIHTEASLAFPVPLQYKPSVKSYWGADRDGGARRHEGIDIFAAKRTPAVAVADGSIRRVGTNNLGGKIIFLRPKGQNYSVYYAHLDSQLVSSGQSVKAGETIGLIGNTGNARTTPPHLHFGIYAMGGAVNPFPFVDHSGKPAPAFNGSDARIGQEFIVNKRIASSRVRVPVRVTGQNTTGYRIRNTDGLEQNIDAKELEPLQAIRTFKADSLIVLYELPRPNATPKSGLEKGSSVQVLAELGPFLYVRSATQTGWIRYKG